MQVEIKIDSAYVEPKIIIITAAMTEDRQIIEGNSANYLW